MSFLSWDDEDTLEEVDINTGSQSVSSAELNLNANLSKDPLNIVPDGILQDVQLVALNRLKQQHLEVGRVDASVDRISREDKMVLGGGDVNQLIPFKYEWAWQKYLAGCNNNWMPTEVPMADDIALWNSADGLTADERRIIYNALGFFSTADTIVGNNLLLIGLHIKNPEMRQYIYRQIFDESLHSFTYQYCIQSLGLSESEVFNQYRENMSMLIKDNWCFKYDESLLNLKDLPVQDLLRNLIAFYVVMEGIFFYCGFSQVLALGRRGKMIGIAEQFQYILRDESNHLNFGIDLINTIKMEHPEVWTSEFQQEVLEMIEEGTVLETVYGFDINPNGNSTVTPQQNAQYMQFIGRRRCEQLGLNSRLAPVSNPFEWMAEMIDISKEKNFFESRVTEYQVGADLGFDKI